MINDHTQTLKCIYDIEIIYFYRWSVLFVVKKIIIHFLQNELRERAEQAIEGMSSKSDELFNAILKFKALHLTEKGFTPHKCSNPKCNFLTCDYCWTWYINNGKEFTERYTEDIPGLNDTVKCQFCKEIDWKVYNKNVLQQLEQTVLGQDAYIKMLRVI